MSTSESMLRWIDENRHYFIEILKSPIMKASIVKSAKTFLTDKEYEDILLARKNNEETNI